MTENYHITSRPLFHVFYYAKQIFIQAYNNNNKMQGPRANLTGAGNSVVMSKGRNVVYGLDTADGSCGILLSVIRRLKVSSEMGVA